MSMNRKVFFLVATILAGPAFGAKYVGVGDSITFGRTGTSRDAYLGFLADYLTDRGETVSTGNEGVRGNTSADLLARLSGVLNRHSDADYMLVMVGTNDVFRWIHEPTLLSPEETRANLFGILDRIQDTSIQPILATVVPRLSGDQDDPNNSETNRLNDIIRSVASSRGVSLARVNANMSGAANQFTYFDSVHPGPLIEPLIAEAFAAVITGQSRGAIDLTGPTPVDLTPLPNAVGVDLNTNIRIVVRELSAGVDAESAVLELGGQAVELVVVPQGGDIVFRYTPPEPLRFGQRVNGRFSVDDTAMPPNTTEFQYTFSALAGNGTNGDVNGSGRVDGADLAILASAFGASSRSRPS